MTIDQGGRITFPNRWGIMRSIMEKMKVGHRAVFRMDQKNSVSTNCQRLRCAKGWRFQQKTNEKNFKPRLIAVTRIE